MGAGILAVVRRLTFREILSFRESDGTCYFKILFVILARGTPGSPDPNKCLDLAYHRR